MINIEKEKLIKLRMHCGVRVEVFLSNDKLKSSIIIISYEQIQNFHGKMCKGNI